MSQGACLTGKEWLQKTRYEKLKEGIKGRETWNSRKERMKQESSSP